MLDKIAEELELKNAIRIIIYFSQASISVFQRVLSGIRIIIKLPS
jgi:hypothetical protein